MNYTQIKNLPGTTLVEVYASWCPHCHRMAPIVENLKEIYAGQVNIVQYDGDAHPQIDEYFGVTSYPTWILYKDGREVYRDSGEMEPTELEDLLDRNI